MKTESMPDFYPVFDVKQEPPDRLHAYIAQLERARSLWDARIRLCEEREYMYKSMLKDVCNFLESVFQATHEHTSETGAKATEMIEAVQRCVKRLEV
jgi:hypothetical protein